MPLSLLEHTLAVTHPRTWPLVLRLALSDLTAGVPPLDLLRARLFSAAAHADADADFDDDDDDNVHATTMGTSMTTAATTT